MMAMKEEKKQLRHYQQQHLLIFCGFDHRKVNERLFLIPYPGLMPMPDKEGGKREHFPLIFRRAKTKS